MTSHVANNPFKEARFVKGILGTDPILDETERAHVAFIGRSNVGKSSLVNAVLGRNHLVRSSSRPGKTTEINFFAVNEDYYFVDLPGYGFARMGEKQREKLRKLILWYLMYTEVPRRQVFIVLDAQAGTTPFDVEMLGMLQEQGEEVYVVVNKIDKLNQKEQHALKMTIQEKITAPVLYTSTTKKKGIQEIRDIISPEKVAV